MNYKSMLLMVVGLWACSGSPPSDPASESGRALYMDVHELGAGKVTAEAVAQAHEADLAAEAAHGVTFLRYWVDEENGRVYCLSRAPNPEAIVETHREAHGLLPDSVGRVTAGE